MKIGDVDIQRIPPSQAIACDNGCTAKAVKYFNDIPLCAECLHDAQQMKWDEDGQFFINSDGEEVHYTVVQKFTVIVPED